MYKKITTVEEYSDVVDQPQAAVRAGIKKKYAPCIRLDVPLLIKLLEYAREDASSDLDLHVLAEEMMDLSEDKGRVLTIGDYEGLISSVKEDTTPKTT